MNSGAGPMNDADDFNEEMRLIVNDSFEASSQNAPMEAKEQRAKVWTELLFEIIPTLRLRDAFERAFSEHESTFPVNAYDIKAAWERIKADERAARDEEIAADKALNPIKYCTEPDRHVDENGNTDVLLGGLGGTEVVVPCPICRPQAHQQRMLDLRKELAVDHPVTEKEMESKVIEMFAEARVKRNPAPKSTDALELIGRLMNQLGVEITDCRSARKRDYLHRGYIRLGQIADRIAAQDRAAA